MQLFSSLLFSAYIRANKRFLFSSLSFYFWIARDEVIFKKIVVVFDSLYFMPFYLYNKTVYNLII